MNTDEMPHDSSVSSLSQSQCLHFKHLLHVTHLGTMDSSAILKLKSLPQKLIWEKGSKGGHV